MILPSSNGAGKGIGLGIAEHLAAHRPREPMVLGWLSLLYLAQSNTYPYASTITPSASCPQLAPSTPSRRSAGEATVSGA